jgi:predicted NodU family carbamoyl transferase
MSRELRVSIIGKKITITNDADVERVYAGDTSEAISRAVEAYCKEIYKEIPISSFSHSIVSSFENITNDTGFNVPETLYKTEAMCDFLNQKLNSLISGTKSKDVRKEILQEFECILDYNYVVLSEEKRVQFEDQIKSVLKELTKAQKSNQHIITQN